MLRFFETAGRNLLPAEAAAGIRHHVALSIVAIDRTDNGYFRAKLAQEKLIEASGIPYTIIRATQFMEFLGGIAGASTNGNTVRLSPGLFQPIAADDVAAIVADVALATPRNGIVEIAGPERASFNEIVARYLKAVGDPREVVRDPEARYWGGRVEERSFVPLGEARLGHIGLDEGLRRSQTKASSGCATWREDQEGSSRRCGLIVGSMGSIFAEQALYGSDAVTTNPAKSGPAKSGPAKSGRA
jgi:NmrA-like family protein